MKTKKNLYQIAEGHGEISVKNPHVAEKTEDLDYIWITTFYKDEDGQNNCLQVTWHLSNNVDINDIKVRTYAISNIKRVQRVIPTPELYQPCGVQYYCINNRLTCTFRINSVSRGFHCFENEETKFSVRLEKSTSNGYVPVSVFSSPFTVKSKRKILAKERRNSDLKDQPLKKKQKRSQISIPLIEPIPLSEIQDEDFFDIFDDELKNELKEYIDQKMEKLSKQIHDKIHQQKILLDKLLLKKYTFNF